MSDKQHLGSIYKRITKKKCCDEWLADPENFYVWYEKRLNKQKGRCKYCHLPGDTEKYYGKHFRKGRRGIHLEVDRKDNSQPYSPENCVLACYPCNNAKSDVFSYEEFLKIGEAIRNVKQNANIAHRTKLAQPADLEREK